MTPGESHLSVQTRNIDRDTTFCLPESAPSSPCSCHCWSPPPLEESSLSYRETVQLCSNLLIRLHQENLISVFKLHNINDDPKVCLPESITPSSCCCLSPPPAPPLPSSAITSPSSHYRPNCHPSSAI